MEIQKMAPHLDMIFVDNGVPKNGRCIVLRYSGGVGEERNHV